MYEDFNQNLKDEFLKLLESDAPQGQQKEQMIQNFLETNSELIPIPNVLNHGLHFDFIISKFPVAHNLVSDYVYLTKSSAQWIVTLVELEISEKSIFTSSMDKEIASASFNHALDQVRSWKAYLKENRGEFLSRLRPLMQPMGGNPIEFQYQLVIGRSADKNKNDRRKEYIAELERERGITIMSYDSLLNWYVTGPRYKKNILRAVGSRFEFKRMNVHPYLAFAWLGNDVLNLSQDQLASLSSDGYMMDEWLAGKSLKVNGKYTNLGPADWLTGKK